MSTASTKLPVESSARPRWPLGPAAVVPLEANPADRDREAGDIAAGAAGDRLVGDQYIVAVCGGQDGGGTCSAHGIRRATDLGNPIGGDGEDAEAGSLGLRWQGIGLADVKEAVAGVNSYCVVSARGANQTLGSMGSERIGGGGD